MKNKISIRTMAGILWTIIFLVFLGINASAYEKEPEKFTYYLSADLSGPMGGTNVSMIPGLSDFCEWYNSTKGGIRGVPVTFKARDNAGNVTKGVAAYEQFRLEKPKPIVGSFHPAFVGQALKDRLAEDKIVNFFNTSSHSVMFPVGYLVGCQIDYPGAVAAVMDWVKKNTAWKNKKIKVGLLTWDNSYGKGIFDPELRKWFAKQPGMELVAEEVFQTRDIDVSTQVVGLKSKGVNWILDNTIVNGPVLINKSLKSMGLLSQDVNDTTLGKIHHAGLGWGVDEHVLRLGGADLMEGYMGLRPWATFDEKDNPGIQLALKWLKKKKRGLKIKTNAYTVKWAKMLLVTHIVEKLVDEKGWKGVTADNFLHELLNTSHFDAMGICNFDYTPTRPYLVTGRIYMMKNGKVLPVSDYVEAPDLRPPQYK